MSQSIHVGGESQIKTGTGSAQALEILGVSVDGVDIEIEDHVSPIYTDTNGGPEGRIPFDEMGYGQTANIRAQLVFYDETILAKLRPTFVGGSEGLQDVAGTLFGAGSKYFRLLVLSPTDGVPWNFLKARMTGSKRVKIGVRQSVWNLSFFALPYSGSSGSTASNVLYNRTTT